MSKHFNMKDTSIDHHDDETSTPEAPVFRAMTMIVEPSVVEPTTVTLNKLGEDVQQKLQITVPPKTSSAAPLNVVTTPAASDATSIGWQQPTLTRLSPYHPLECNNRRFPLHTLDAVIDQLTTSFRLNSLTVQYEDCPISALCESLDQVRFAVSIWESNETNSELIVELQRIGGDCVLFGRYARDILSAVVQRCRDATPVAPCPKLRLAALPFPPVLCCAPVNSNNNSLLPMVATKEQEEETALSALEITQGMLTSNRYDSRQLGLYSLVLLLDPWQSGNAIATFAAQQILLPGSCCSESQKIILTLALKGHWPQPQCQQCFSTSCGAMDIVDPATECHSYLALTALTRALQVLCTSSQADSWLPSCVTQCRLCCNTDLLSCLTERVTKASLQPHEAFYATLALVALCQAQPDLTCRISKHSIEQALKVGCSRHAALETASEQLLVVLTDLQAH